MIIMVSTLAAAINECRHIKPEELIQDTIKAVNRPGQAQKENDTECSSKAKTGLLQEERR